MKKLRLLSTIADLAWYLSILALFIMFGLFIYALIAGDDSIVTLHGEYINLKDPWHLLLIGMGLSISLILLYALFLFRKVLSSFRGMQLFRIEVIDNLKRIGNLIMIAGVLSFFVDFLFDLKVHPEVSIKFIPVQLVAYLVIGSFFIVLAEVFARGKELQEENELTV